MRIDRVVVVVPARNEAALIGACLDALAVAACAPAAAGVGVDVLVVADRCTDRTAEVCAERGVAVLAMAAGDVGQARDAGIRVATAGLDPDATWVACTDADSTVDPDWITEQVALAERGADAVLGVVDVSDPTPAFSALYLDAHRSSTRPHPHVHGACLGLLLRAYDRVGGFRPLHVGEDQDLADRLDVAADLTVVRSTAVRVSTSNRRSSRVRGGFADLLADLDRAPGRGVTVGAERGAER